LSVNNLLVYKLILIYKALSFINVLPGGTTRPWAVYVLGHDGRPQQFVVKLFKDKPLQSQPAVANEVFGSVMAELFDLQTPNIAFIEFTNEFIDTLAPPQRHQLSTAQPGYKFGCRYIEVPFRYSTALATRFVANYDIESIYAFDNLILNRDRDAIKPNMLLVGQDAFLIDHEISIVGGHFAQQELQQGNWTYQYQEHVFYNHLKSRSLDDIKKSFESFGWYLQNVSGCCRSRRG
jgi:hypothetical protein